MRRALIILGLVVGALGVLIIAGVVVMTMTSYGRERLRRQVVEAVDSKTRGRVVRIGRVEGNLLRGVVLIDVWIGDRAGNVFVAADTVTSRYGLRYLMRKKVVLSDVRLVKPLIVLDRPPGGQWNFKTLFGGKKTTVDTTLGFGDWIRFERAEMVDGRLLIRRPWTPDEHLAGAERDRDIAEHLAGGSRTHVIGVPGGYQQVIDFRSIYGTFPLILLRDPEVEHRIVEVATLKMIAAPFNPPVAEIRDLSGTIQFDGDSLWFSETRLAAPGSKIRGNGRFEFKSKDFALKLRGEPVSTADLRWLFPRLPAEGQGTLDFALTWRDDVNTYAATDAAVNIEGARATGDFAITLAPDSTFFHDTDVRFSGVDTRLIEQLVSGARFPRRGAFAGRAAIDGSLRALALDADVAFDETGGGRSRIAAVGGVGFGAGAMRANNLRLRASNFHLDLLTTARENLPVFGTASGTARLDGSTATRLVFRADLAHDLDGEVSRVAGRGAVRLTGGTWLDIDAEAKPIALAAVGRFAPGLGLRNFASGPIRILGPMDDLRIDGRFTTTDGGVLGVESRLDLTGEKRYDAALVAHLFNANLIIARAPASSLTARATIRGAGTDPETMRAALTVDVAETSSLVGVGFDSATVRMAIADGLVRVDSLRVAGPAGRIDAEGTLAVGGTLAGEMSYRVAIDSLEAFNRFIGGDSAGIVRPRPARRAKAMAAARSDSVKVAEATEVERAVTGEAGPALVVDTPTVLRRDSLAGKLRLAGTVRGTARDLAIRGRAAVEGLAARGYTLERGRFEYAVDGLGGTSPAFLLAAQMDTATAAGFQLDSVEARIAYRADRGQLDVLVHQHEDQTLRAQLGFELHRDHREIHVANAILDLDTTRWVSTRPGAVRWGAAGIELDSIELRSKPHGRIFLDGRLPTTGAADLRIAIDNFDIGGVTALLQSDLPADGLISVDGRLRGTRAAPRFEGAFGTIDGRWGSAIVPDFHASLAYADRRLTFRGEIERLGGLALGTIEGSVPVDLALTGVTGGRWLDQPITVDLTADSLPIDLLSEFTGAISEVRGRAVGFVSLRGTGKHPRLAGAIALDHGRVRIPYLGVTVRNLAGSIRMRDDALIIDSLVGFSRGPVRLAGRLNVAKWSEPEFELRLIAMNARVLDNERGRLFADGTLKLDGPFEAPYVTGDIRIRNGVLYIPDSDGKSVIGTDDPALFAVLDTSLAINEDIFPSRSPLMANLRSDVTLAVDRDVWIRSKDANVEVYTVDPILMHIDRRSNVGLALEGSVNTDRGQYTFLSRRFEIRRGSATFVGGPTLNPTLQITGELPVRGLPNKEAFMLRVIIGGTLDNMKLSLESDAQPPLTQSDLLSYLAFGEPTSSLLPQEGSSLTSASGGTNAGAIGSLAVRQMASVALGVAVDELEGTAGERLGADVFNIAPKDIPTELSVKTTEGFLAGTEVEAGWYVDRRTFLGVQQSLKVVGTNPGLTVQRRIGKGYFVESTFEPRFLLREPTLRESSAARAVSVFGLFLGREWRF